MEVGVARRARTVPCGEASFGACDVCVCVCVRGGEGQKAEESSAASGNCSTCSQHIATCLSGYGIEREGSTRANATLILGYERKGVY